jgi:hypothetical protein
MRVHGQHSWLLAHQSNRARQRLLQVPRLGFLPLPCDQHVQSWLGDAQSGVSLCVLGRSPPCGCFTWLVLPKVFRCMFGTEDSGTAKWVFPLTCAHHKHLRHWDMIQSADGRQAGTGPRAANQLLFNTSPTAAACERGIARAVRAPPCAAITSSATCR